MALVSLEKASFRHPQTDKPVWTGVDLEVNRGDRLLVVGPSGAGKSTLLGVMTGLVPRLTAGRLGGKLTLGYTRAGLVLQNPDAQLVTPSVFEEVAFALENRSWPVAQIRERVIATLEKLGLDRLAFRATTTLSGGESQRLSLACALAQDPEIYFLDEPTAYLDPWAAAQFFQDLALVLEDQAVVLVEHRAAEARGLVNRAVVLEKYGATTEVAPLLATRHWEPAPRFLASAVVSPGKVLKVENLAHRYQGADPVWSGLTGEFLPGRIAAVMGPSGSGKSTLLAKLAGLIPSPRNTVFWGEEDLSRIPPRRLYSDLLLIPQNPEHFFLHMTAAREWQSSGAPREKLAAAAAQFGLDPTSGLHPSLLSEGEKRRLTLALAFLSSRSVLLLDEPTYGLDEVSFAALVQGLGVLRDQGRTVVLVTHSPELVRACADDLWFLNQGSWSRSPVADLDSLLPEVGRV